MELILNIENYEENHLLFKETRIGFLEDDILSYNTDIDNIKINLNKFSFIKENTETLLKLTKDLCTLKIKDLNNSIEIPIDYISCNYEHNKHITIEYKLASQDKPLKLVIEMSEQNDI